ncbi:hypothetical protein VTO73DRAFT_15491 [Trametes versicolor]
MANGAIVPSEGNWQGVFEFEGVKVDSSFELFPSKGAWSFLIGKPMLEALCAQHDYSTDTIRVRDRYTNATLRNQRGKTWGDNSLKAKGLNLALDAKMCLAPEIDADASASAKQESTERENANNDLEHDIALTYIQQTAKRQQHKVTIEDVDEDDSSHEAEQAPTQPRRSEPKPAKKRGSATKALWMAGRRRVARKWRIQRAEDKARHQRWLATRKTPETAPNDNQQDELYVGPDAPEQELQDTENLYEIPVNTISSIAEETDNIFTRTTEPFKEARVQAIVDAVQLGEDLTAEERLEVTALLKEYADCFALSVKEVTPVPGAVHTLKVPADATFSKRVHQRPLTPPQREYVHKKIDELLAAGAIAQCSPSDVKCIAPITLAHKAHEGDGLTLDELRVRVNEECQESSMPKAFNVPERPKTEAPPEAPTVVPKWRICQNYGEINRVTEIAPMPQGDIRQKQQNVSGHRWVSTFDFASGFYAVTLAEESRPYTCFYIEGRGYFWCVKMPFGLTGAPATFAHMTAVHLHDLLGDGTMELFVDDGATAGDDFGELMGKLRRILGRIRTSGLSLSPSKCKWFMTETVFAGASVGPQGVAPDTAKLTAVVDWKRPEDALNLGSFLGLTSHFRDLIKDYARVEAPLRDLLRNVHIPSGTKKGMFRKAMSNYKLSSLWTDVHQATFLKLKTLLTSEPMLRRPRWDGTPFVLTTDGSKDGFGAVLAQRFTDVLPSGKQVQRSHPIAYASKRTSKSEEKYKSFISEFAALKFGLDKFSDIIWGFPVLLETDCSALRDVIANDKLSSTHARWRDGILAYQIVDIKHIPGKHNGVADGLSRVGEGAEREAGDGSDWTVCEDWEAMTGIVNDLFQVTSVSEEEDDVDALLDRFRDEPIFSEVVRAIMNDTEGVEPRVARRARHRAERYSIANGKLWRTNGGTATRARARVECITRAEAVERAREEHTKHGHWGRDSIKIAMTDRYWSPKLDASILTTIQHCARCKSFGPTHLHALLDPITRRHPFELLVGDYLSLPDGKGGYHTVGVYLDTFSQHVWAFKYKTAGTAKTTNDALRQIFQGFAPPETFMTDGGKHFNNKDVQEYCAQWGVTPHIVAAYSPWVNGLVEGTNKLLLHVLKRLCAPDVGEDNWDEDVTQKDWDSLPRQWTDHLDDAVKCLNYRILPALKFSPKELLLGKVVNTPATTVTIASSPLSVEDAAKHVAYVAQQHLDGYDEALRHALKRKKAFDKRVLASAAGEVVFETGTLVQVYRSDLDYTFKTERKLLPKWSTPYRVVRRVNHSYELTTLGDMPIAGLFNTRRLRKFEPRPGTRLAEAENARRSQESAQSGARTDQQT